MTKITYHLQIWLRASKVKAELISDGTPQNERLIRLNQIAIQQMQVLEERSNRNLLK